MKLLLSILLLTVVTQNTSFGVKGTLVPIFGIIDRLLEGLTNLLDPIVNDVGGLLTNLDTEVSDLATGVLGTVSNLIDNLISLVDDYLGEARSTGKLVDACANRTDELKLLKQKISNEVEKCRENLDIELANVSTVLKEQRDRGISVISSLAKSLQNCLRGLFIAICVTKAQQMSLGEIQEIVKNAENLKQKISLASEDVAKCLNDAEENGRELADQIYQDIQQCITETRAVEGKSFSV